MFSREQLQADLAAMGIGAGDTLIVHSSFKSIGGVDGGPPGVVEALKSVIGPRGLLVMPTFVFGFTAQFNVERTPSRTGVISEAFRRSTGVFRSAHPTHSTALWGEDAERIATAHDTAAGLDIGSPFHLAAQRPGARILFFGVDGKVNSHVHVCEAILKLPYVEETYWNGRVCSYDVTVPGKSVTRRINTRTPGCSQGFLVVDIELEKRGQLRHVAFGAAECALLNRGDIPAVVRDLTAAKSDALLCANPECSFCPGARTSLRSHGLL